MTGFRDAPQAIATDGQTTTLLRKRAAFEQLPTVSVAADNIISAVKSESRVDVEAPLSSLRMFNTGRITRGSGGVDVEKRAFYQLCDRMRFAVPSEARPESFGRYLASCPPEMRAIHFNHWAAQAEDKPVVLRTRNGSETRGVFAAVTPGYTAYDVDSVTSVIADTLSTEDCRVEGSYTGYGLNFRALWMTDVQPRQGDIFKSGVEIKTSDQGGGSILVRAVVMRATCSNMDLVSKRVVEFVRRTHRGDVNEIRDTLAEGIGIVRDRTSGFFDLYGRATQTTVGQTEDDIKAMFARFVANKIDVRGQQRKVEPVLALPNVRRQTLADYMFQAWKQEPGYTQADLYNAVTRTAHEQEWVRVDMRDELESQADRVLMMELD